MKFSSTKSLALIAVAAGIMGGARAQWSFVCEDPMNMMPRSGDHFFVGVGNAMFRCHMGVAGTATYGGMNGPCYAPNAVTVNLRGRFGFMVGSEGSIQDSNPADPANSGFDDSNMRLTPGMPLDPGNSYGYVVSTRDGAKTLFGGNGLGTTFVGASNRYFTTSTTNDNVLIDLRVDLVGDAARFRWRMTNVGTETSGIGLWFGSKISMWAVNGSDLNGFNMVGGADMSAPPSTPASIKGAYVTLPNGRPPLTEKRFNRNTDPANFPSTASFWFGQTTPFGLQIENGPTSSTIDENNQSDATEASELALGNGFFMLGGDGTDAPTFPDFQFGDVNWLGDPSFIQKFPETQVPVNGSKTIVHYVRSPWALSSYTVPYAVTIDAPKLVATDGTNLNGLRPNPMTMRVYIDNVGSYGGAETGFDLQNVRVTLQLPPGLSLSAGEQATKILSIVPSRQVRSVDYSVVADGVIYGSLPYSVLVEPPGVPSKTLNGAIQVSATPKLEVKDGANLVTLPWSFQDTSLEAILGLVVPDDFRAYKWNPDLQGYVIATNAERGTGYWILANGDFGVINLLSNPQAPPDVPTGAPYLQLKSGWNLIGNPYQFPIRVGQLLGVPATVSGAPNMTWQEMINGGIVSGALASYNNSTGDYTFTEGLDTVLEPNKGYWMYIAVLNNNQGVALTLQYPPVFEPGLPGSSRSASREWIQSERKWRLQLSARTTGSVDAQNFVGMVPTTAEANRLRQPEPPITPIHDVGLYTEEMVNGKKLALAHSFGEKATNKTWNVKVTSTKPGMITLTWPNLSTVPKNYRFRVTDLATNVTRDLRQTSGYSFTMAEAGMREFKVEATVGGAGAALIGNMTATRPSRDRLAPFTINYTLSTEATTSIRVLSNSGREVFTVSRGRADRVGENSATWTLRDNANRLVAPGTYRVEVIATTSEGARVRKVIPVNVIR